MNELAIKQGTAKLAISNSARELIKACVSDNTLKAYRRALDSLAVWLDSELSDAVLAEYITHLHQSGKASSTIAQVVTPVKWKAKNVYRPDEVDEILEEGTEEFVENYPQYGGK